MARASASTKPLQATLALTRLVDDGLFNAFTGLCSWRGMFYLAYRQATGHMPGGHPPGAVVVLRSSNGDAWQEVARFATGGDDRDPHFLVHPDRLGLLWATYTPIEHRLTTYHWQVKPLLLLSHTAWSQDGQRWTPPEPAFRWQYWLWSGLWEPARQRWRAATYHIGANGDSTLLTLVSSTFGNQWWHWALLRDDPHMTLSEPCLWQPAPDMLACLVRCEALDSGDDDPLATLERPALLGTSAWPYRDWAWQDLSTIIHSPAVCMTPYGTLVAGRTPATPLRSAVPFRPTVTVQHHETRQPSERHPVSLDHPSWVCVVWHLEGTRLTELMRLPSGGDCAYPGLVWDDAGQRVLVSYYSQHAYLDAQGRVTKAARGWPLPADIYLAALTLGKDTGTRGRGDVGTRA